MFDRLKPPHLRLAALLVALPIAALGASTLTSRATMTLVAHGPIQAGHSAVDCTGCHENSPGTLRQQIQANLQYTLGNRALPVGFAKQPVTSAQCLHCHDRPNERHPIYRFNEPRFAQALQSIAANTCLGCHSEHTGARAEIDTGFCQSCHEDVALKQDPLDVAHVQLAAQGNWGSCLGCHDFHGNHARSAQTRLIDAYATGEIEAYLSNGPSPYGTAKTYEAATE
ncbi:hypothetical protein IV417_13960 [Alphaproteobacteria bacterium KMM 3653]|uniref:Tetrahaem cytochrome domain-containing protein n=1 Tax=Harenicola maris TaxID=2841044 RepID=A0AAP2CU06_9RHOB|nr:hypothetical protein [Harenicola maris]